jgi:excisionase family DNA binding protein
VHTSGQTDWIADAIATLQPLATVDEVRGVLRCSRRQVYRLTTAQRLQSFKQTQQGSSKLLIPRASVEAYLRSLEA